MWIVKFLKLKIKFGSWNFEGLLKDGILKWTWKLESKKNIWGMRFLKESRYWKFLGNYVRMEVRIWPLESA